jgi:hypothetical protein
MSTTEPSVTDELAAIKAQITTLQSQAAENEQLKAQIVSLQKAATKRIMRTAGVAEGDNPYPALTAHIRAGNHPNTYRPVTTGKVTCLDCGEIDSLNPPEEAGEFPAQVRNTEVLA